MLDLSRPSTLKTRDLKLRLHDPSQSVRECEVGFVIHRNMLHSKEAISCFSGSGLPASTIFDHLQHCFFSMWSTLLQRGQVWYASLKLFMKKGIRQQHSTNLQQSNTHLNKPVRPDGSPAAHGRKEAAEASARHPPAADEE